MPGPTTEGSIVAYLRLNDSDWNETLDRAEARARRLGAVDPTITVDANTAGAMSKIEAVEAAKARLGGSDASVGVSGSPAKIDSVVAAQKRLEVAERAAANAASSQYLAELRLEDVQGRRNKSAYALAAAEEAVARATRNAEAAELRHMASSTALAQAQEAVARATLEDAGAQEVDAAATDKANNSRGLAISRTGLIVAAIAVLIPMLAPLAGYAVGAAGALAGMGAAGVLAIVGIKQAMEAGTTTGAQYSTGLQTLKGDLNSLAGTAATGMLVWFQQAVRQITAAMPSLNGQISTFTTLLGSAGVRALQGVLNTLRVLNPLFVQAGVYVDQLAAGFERWTGNGGLQRFATYAQASLPIVASTLGQLASAALHLIESLSPLGTITLGALQAVATVINALPSGTLVALAAGATTAVVAFKAWNVIAPLIDKVSLAVRGVGLEMTAAGGPIGLMIGALSLAAAAFVGFAVQAQKAQQAAGEFATALEQDNGALSKNVALLAQKQLHDNGGIEAGHKLGLTTQTLVGYFLNQSDAIKQVDEATRKYSDGSKGQEAQLKKTGMSALEMSVSQDALKGALNQVGSEVEGGTKQLKQQQEALDAVKNSSDATAGSSKNQAAAQEALAARYGMTVDQLNAADGAQKQNADSAAATTRQLQLENDAAGLLTNAFTLLNGGTLDVAQAQTGAAAASNSLLDALKNNGTAIDGTTKAAVANQQAIQQKVAADQQSAEAIAKQTGSTEAGTQAFAASKQALLEQLAAQGLLTPAIQAYIDKLYAVPPVVKTRAELDSDAAAAKAAQLSADLAAMTRQWTIPVKIVTTGTMPTAGHFAAQQSGGPVNGTVYRAGGGGIPDWRAMFRPKGTDTVPTMLTPGEFVVRQPSASVNPGFLKAYNDNPQAALSAVANSGASQSSDRPIYMDGVGLVGWIREIAGQEAQLIFNTGMNRAAQELTGGLA